MSRTGKRRTLRRARANRGLSWDGRSRIQFAGTDVRVPRDRWQTLGLRVEGNRLAVALDGRELFAATDRTFAEAGRVGLWTKADSRDRQLNRVGAEFR